MDQEEVVEVDLQVVELDQHFNKEEVAVVEFNEQL